MNFITLFLTVLVMSTVTSLAIMLVKRIMKKSASPFFHYYIWLILLVRLCFPILPQSDISIYNLFSEYLSLPQTSMTDAYLAEFAEDELELDFEGEAKADSPLESQTLPQFKLYDKYSVSEIEVGERASRLLGFPWDTAALVVYLCVTSALLCGLVLEYIEQRRILLDTSIPCNIKEINDAAHDMALSLGLKRPVRLRIGRKSLVYGCFDRFVLLDIDMLDSYEMILAHELTHCRYYDNLMNILIAVLRKLYWFNPIALKALDMINSDMELLCDSRAVARFKIRKDEYAMLLYRSVKMNDEKEARPISAASMSSAGKQLIKRLDFLGRPATRARKLSFAVSLLLLAATTASCLTNPIIAMKENPSELYMSRFASNAASGDIVLPEANDKVTGRGFIDMLLLALDSVDLPASSRETLETFKAGGADGFYDSLCAEYDAFRPAVTTRFLSGIDLDGTITNQQAAFLMNHLLIYLNRGRIFVTDDEGNIDSTLYIPSLLESDEFDEISDSLKAQGEKGEASAKKLMAFYSSRSYDSLQTTDKLGAPLGEDELERRKLELQTISPYVDAIDGILLYDPYASARENNLIAGMFKSVGANYTDTQSLHDMANYPTMLPHVIGKDSFEDNLIGTITDETLKAEIKAAYSCDESAKLYTLDLSIGEELLASLGMRLARNSSYTYEQQLIDHSLNGYSLLEHSADGRLTFADIYPTAEELPTSLASEESYLFGDSQCVLKVMTRSAFLKLCDAIDNEKDVMKLNAVYAYKNANDPKLSPKEKAELEALWGKFGDEGIYICDPNLSDRELTSLEAIYAKAFTESELSGVYLMYVRPYSAYNDEFRINEYALNSVRELARCGILKDGGALGAETQLKYSDAAEMAVKFVSGLVAY